MNVEFISFLIVFVAGFVVITGPVARFFPRRLAQLLAGAMVIRAIGSLFRYSVIYHLYGRGDAEQYYSAGLYYADLIWQGNFSFLHGQLWGGHWWGTQAVMFLSGFVIALVGPSQRAEFLFFSILSLFALLLFAKAFEKNYPQSDLKNYVRWLVFWPSLWFWPSSVGKDALILLSTALLVFGYTSKGKNIAWIPLALGIFIAGAIRPHVAGVMVVSLGIAHWISPSKRWSAFHVAQGLLILVMLVLVLRQGFSDLGLEPGEVENLKDYVNMISKRSSEGGSVIQTPGASIQAVPLAIVNVLFRPFPWEASSPLMAAASIEMAIFWTVVIKRRRRVLDLIKHWRSNRLLCMVVPLTVLYVLMLGMAVGNLGIIARQRIHIMPLLFIWVEALPLLAKVPRPVTGIRRIFPYSPALRGVPGNFKSLP